MSLKALCDLTSEKISLKLDLLRLPDGQSMVIIHPSIELAEKYPQLSQAVQITAKPEDIEAEVTKVINGYKPMITDAVDTLSLVEAQLAEAKKAGQAKTAAKTVVKPAGKPTPTGTTTTAGVKPGQPLGKTGSETPAATPPALDLFSLPPSTETVAPGSADDEDDGSDESSNTASAAPALLPLED